MPVEDLLLEMSDLATKRVELSHDATQGRLRMNRHGILRFLHQRQQRVDAGKALGLHDTVLAKMRTQCVDLHDPLPDQMVAGLLQHECSLLLFRLHRREPHG